MLRKAERREGLAVTLGNLRLLVLRGWNGINNRTVVGMERHLAGQPVDDGRQNRQKIHNHKKVEQLLLHVRPEADDRAARDELQGEEHFEDVISGLERGRFFGRAVPRNGAHAEERDADDDQNAHECGEHFCGRAGVLIEHDVVHLLVPLDWIRGLFAAVRALLLLLSCCLVRFLTGIGTSALVVIAMPSSDMAGSCSLSR